jgi:hypothetical protein
MTDKAEEIVRLFRKHRAIEERQGLLFERILAMMEELPTQGERDYVEKQLNKISGDPINDWLKQK